MCKLNTLLCSSAWAWDSFRISARARFSSFCPVFFRFKTQDDLFCNQDLEMWVDGYSIGKLFQSTRSSVLVLGVTLSTPCKGGSTALFVDAPAAGVDGRGEAEARTIQGSLQRPPWDLHANALRARLAIAIGDGHYVAGEASNHNPTDAFQRLFDGAGRVARTAWSGFHRLDKAGVKACRDVPLAEEFAVMLKDLEAAFGGGQGRQVDKQVCDFMNIKFFVGRKPGSTRKFVYFSGAPSIYLKKFPSYYRSIQLRRTHAEEGRTNKTVQWWTELGQRLANAKMFVFAMAFQQSLEITKPWALAVQASNTTPWHLQDCVRSMKVKLQTQLAQLQWLSHILQVLRLLQPYVPTSDLAAFFRAISPRFRRGSSLLACALPSLWLHGRFCGLNVVLDAEPTEHGSAEVLLHNACQCAFRKGTVLQPGRPSAPVQWERWAAILRRRQARDPSIQIPEAVTMACWVCPSGPLCNQESFKPGRCPSELGHRVARAALKQKVPHRGCVLNKFAAHTATQVLEGLAAAVAFIRQFIQHVVPRRSLVKVSWFAFLFACRDVEKSWAPRFFLIHGFDNNTYVGPNNARKKSFEFKDNYDGDVGVKRSLAFLRGAACDCFSPQVLCAPELSESAVTAFELVPL